MAPRKRGSKAVNNVPKADEPAPWAPEATSTAAAVILPVLAAPASPRASPKSPTRTSPDKAQGSPRTSQPPSSIKGGRRSRISDSDYIEMVTAFSDGKQELKRLKVWSRKNKDERMKLIFADKFPESRLESGRPITVKEFTNALDRMKQKFSVVTENDNKSGKGRGARTTMTDELYGACSAAWAYDPAVVVVAKHIGSAAGGIEGKSKGKLATVALKVNTFENKFVVLNVVHPLL